MQVGVDVTCIHTSFGGHDPSGFGDMATFQKWPNFPFGVILLPAIVLSRGMESMVIKKFNRLESAQKIYASRD